MNKKSFNKITFLPFISLGIIIIYLIINSFIGKSLQNPTDISNLYTSPFLLLLWGILGCSGIWILVRNNNNRKLTLLLFHFSLILILLGACVTHFTHESGILHLRKGIEKNKFVSFKSNKLVKLPFFIELADFNVINYPGTTTAADYKSSIRIKTENESFFTTISMNNILKHGGYRFYQTGFDDDKNGSILTVTYDKWGVRLTYLGYGLLFISMLMVLINPQSKFRKLLKNNQWKLLSLLLLFWSIPDDGSAKSYTLSTEELESFKQILIQHQGRVTTIENFATDFTKKITGKRSYNEYSATEVLCGWIFNPEKWQNEPMFKIKGEYEQSVLGITSNFAKFTDFFNEDKSYKIGSYLSQPYSVQEKKKYWKKLSPVDEKAQMIFMLHAGSLMKIFPISNKNNIELVSLNEIKSNSTVSADSLFINRYFSLLYDSVRNGNSCKNLIEKFKTYQRDTLGENAPSTIQLKAENLYLKFNYLPFMGYLSLTIGIIAFFILCYQLIKNIRFRSFYMVCLGFLIISFIYLSFILLLRGIISERLPFSNGYETLLSIAWFSQICALSVRKKINISLPIGILISGFALIGSTLSDANPQITPLMPVLNSPLLSIHVSLMMISYTFVGFISILSLLSVIMHLFKENPDKIESFTLLNRVLLYPTIFFMTAGIFIGAIWANISWGNYWSWDPKECWALISMLYYSIALHNDSLPFLRKPVYFHLYLIIGTLLILITFFGVNYYFGGMHSYT